MAVALLFCLTTYPQVSAWDAVIAFILAVVSSGCVLCSALYYWRVEAHKRLVALFYDGVYWHLTFHSSGKRPRLYRAELVRGSSVTYRSLFFLTFRTLTGKTVRVDLWRDQVSPTAFRRLYVLLNWAKTNLD